MSMNQTQDAGTGGATEKAQEVAAQAMEKADAVKSGASDRIRGQLDTRSTQIADQVAPFAQALHKAGDHLELQQAGSGAKAAHRLANQADQLSSYLRSSNADRLLGDIEGFARRRPWAAGGLGVALGFVGARFLKASSENRYATTSRPYHDVGPASDLPLRREVESTPQPFVDEPLRAS
jgi:hypothetical protein